LKSPGAEALEGDPVRERVENSGLHSGRPDDLAAVRRIADPRGGVDRKPT
jgi:hypothetical protein